METITSLPQATRNLFKTAMEITPDWHLKHQAAFQQYVDNAVSKTINLPESATTQDLGQICWNAWKQGLKGITIFRNKSRMAQVLQKGVISDAIACKRCAS